ncbi:MAG: hypothetical protein D8M57_01510 [Candidatus Scalindua sp. AMX11]|nr:MAG: hypothetical protein DWQ00_15495 [Candidatus Scalindua sp.]RZV93115.1 MAG: hypothetical protein EX341_04425 [Candidatus Scalindua sp. SCAELEC01]TDE66741.1 MAG: hypothetical protein D8M57_01510 [Candidatus Scalindua sp. AMX11]GJQ58052.1 MAG: hypothetical protein SCALA701_08530 [Candidatus Scalindua sp.]
MIKKPMLSYLIESKDLLESLKQETSSLLEKCNPVTGIEVTSKRADGPEEYNGPIKIKEREKRPLMVRTEYFNLCNEIIVH